MFQDPEVHCRQQGDTLTPLGAQLVHAPSGTIEDLTGKTVKFVMYGITGTLKTAEAEATVVDAAVGKVKYDLQAEDVDTVGTFYFYWHVYAGAKRDSYPAVKRMQILEVQAAF